MDLNFEIFMIVLLVLSIVVVGNFLRDGQSNALEGGLLVVCFRSLHKVCLRIEDVGYADECVC
jgi:Ca2+:H+ antiporter